MTAFAACPQLGQNLIKDGVLRIDETLQIIKIRHMLSPGIADGVLGLRLGPILDSSASAGRGNRNVNHLPGFRWLQSCLHTNGIVTLAPPRLPKLMEGTRALQEAFVGAAMSL